MIDVLHKFRWVSFRRWYRKRKRRGRVLPPPLPGPNDPVPPMVMYNVKWEKEVRP